MPTRRAALLLCLALPLLLFPIVAWAGPLHDAAGKAPAQATDTPTPPYEWSGTLDSGEQYLVERRWTYGERGIFLAVVALIAVSLVQFTYTVVRAEFSQRRQK